MSLGAVEQLEHGMRSWLACWPANSDGVTVRLVLRAGVLRSPHDWGVRMLGDLPPPNFN